MVTQMFSTNLSVEAALQIQERQVGFYLERIRQEFDEEKAQEFLSAVEELNQQNPNPQDGFDVPRGMKLEQIFMTRIKGMTAQQYGEYLRGLD